MSSPPAIDFRRTSEFPARSPILKLVAKAPGERLSWAEVMRLALYHPEHGYYADSPRRVGRTGDFYTAVSVGPLYGQLLAQVAAEVWTSLGRPEDFAIIEQGAHDGQLAQDIWGGWPEGPKPSYVIIEPQPGYVKVQQARLQPLMGSRISWISHLAEALSYPPHAFFVCNELLDAFPVHRMRWTGAEWRELWVTADGQWQERKIADAELKDEVDRLPNDLPAGYTTEVHLASVQWMAALSALPFRGAVLIADYGYESAEYYLPERCEGTLRRYRAHRTDGDVLQDLGACDLTAHINFSRIIEVAEAAGLRIERFSDQGRFLTRAAESWLRSLDGQKPTPATASLLRQFQSLTHPSHMGAAFRLLILKKP